jgi:hypothetical protein
MFGLMLPLGEQFTFMFYYFANSYISITACYTHEWEKWWKNPQEVNKSRLLELFRQNSGSTVPIHG